MKRSKKVQNKKKPKSGPQGEAPRSQQLSDDQLDGVAGGAAIFMQTVSNASVSSGGDRPTESLSSITVTKVVDKSTPTL
jgi:hypothetical protein